MSTSISRLVAQRDRISRARFEMVVRGQAYRLWKGNVWRRRNRDWYRAHSEFVITGTDPILPNDPRHVQVRIRAEQLYQECKAGDALEDWLAAEQTVANMYVIAD